MWLPAKSVSPLLGIETSLTDTYSAIESSRLGSGQLENAKFGLRSSLTEGMNALEPGVIGTFVAPNGVASLVRPVLDVCISLDLAFSNILRRKSAPQYVSQSSERTIMQRSNLC